MKKRIKKVVLSWTTWLIIGGLSINNLFFESAWGGNYEIDNNVFEYLLAVVTGGLLVGTMFLPTKMNELYDKFIK
jgi:hypothetical protein